MPRVKTKAMDGYQAQAQSFLEAHHLDVLIALTEDHKCPPWTPHVPSVKGCRKCGMVHGDRYRVTIRRAGTTVTALRERHPGPKTPHAISFDFWGSLGDRETDRRVTACDVLACVSADANYPTDPDTVIADMGMHADSRRDYQSAIQIARFATRLQRFFTLEEMTDLAEVNSMNNPGRAVRDVRSVPSVSSDSSTK
jgi:hypothetical protein